MPRFPALPLSNHTVVNLFTNHEQNSSSRRCRNAQHSAFFRQRFSNTHTRQFPLGQIPRKRLLLRASAKPLLARAFLRVRRAAIEQKQEFLRTHYIALWDVAAECSIRGSADSSISAVTANDIAPLLRSTQIKAVFLNGQTAQKLFRKYLSEETAKFGCTVTALPSTSPANASYSLEKLAAEWGSAIRTVLMV